jgi:hypothetical protein
MVRFLAIDLVLSLIVLAAPVCSMNEHLRGREEKGRKRTEKSLLLFPRRRSSLEHHEKPVALQVVFAVHHPQSSCLKPHTPAPIMSLSISAKPTYLDETYEVKDDQQLDTQQAILTSQDGQVAVTEKGPTGYAPADADERRLDQRINRKLDFIVLPVMAVNYALAGLDKNSLGEENAGPALFPICNPFETR